MKTNIEYYSQRISSADYYGGNRGITHSNMLRDIKGEWGSVGNYRYIGSVPETTVVNRYIKTTKPAGKQVVPDEALMVLLGGPFQQVGEEYEAVGGENQKVG